ncbi:YjbH domain-containing protein [Phocaeicola dorei]|uniref:YjbH domain-containing protein n=1 Tax=Phocaeicola dorei TaxID=357276 RepID=UPI00321A7126
MKKFLFCLLCCVYWNVMQAQEYSGITGMIHVPTAEMATEGEARAGVFFLNQEFLPSNLFYQYGHKHNTTNHFLAITPFSWLELAYVCTLYKGIDQYGEVGFSRKDRYFAVKVRPLKEGKWWPAIAIGAQDPGRTMEDPNGDFAYFQNFYIAATKHFAWKRHELGVHLAYRYYRSDFNVKWRGIAGGITYRPAFAKNLRAVVEYTGNDINIGVDYLLWRYFFLQASLQNGQYFTGGLCFKINLLGKKNAN